MTPNLILHNEDGTVFAVIPGGKLNPIEAHAKGVKLFGKPMDLTHEDADGRHFSPVIAPATVKI